MATKPADDRRNTSRFAIALEVKVVFENDHSCTLKTRDISDSGVFLVMGEGELPAIGTRVEMQVLENMFNQNDEEPPVVKGEVVRRTEDGIGVQFIISD